MTDLFIGARCMTPIGPCTVLALTPYQARVQYDSGDDPTWTLRTNLGELIEEEDEREPSVAELLDSCAALLEMARVRMRRDEESDTNGQ